MHFALFAKMGDKYAAFIRILVIHNHAAQFTLHDQTQNDNVKLIHPNFVSLPPPPPSWNANVRTYNSDKHTHSLCNKKRERENYNIFPWLDNSYFINN